MLQAIGGMVLGGPATFNGIDGFGVDTGIEVPSISTLIVIGGSGGSGVSDLLADVAPDTAALRHGSCDAAQSLSLGGYFTAAGC